MNEVEEGLWRAAVRGDTEALPGFTAGVEEHRTAATIYGCQHIGSNFYISVSGASVVDDPRIDLASGGLGERSATELLHAIA